MMSSSDDMIDTNEMNTSHLQSSFKKQKKMNHYVSDSSISTSYAICWNKRKIVQAQQHHCEIEIKKLKISRQQAKCRRNDIGSFGLLNTKEGFIPLVISSSFCHSVYSCLNCSSGMCFLSNRRSYKGKEKSLI